MSYKTIDIVLHEKSGSARQSLCLKQAVIAGWTGRDQRALEHHIRELEELGIQRPASTPIYYRVSVSRITTESEIQVCANESSGEVEFVLTRIDGRLCVGVGSDHTDRKVETLGVTLSKQSCEKPIGQDFWPMTEVVGHWDQLRLRSWILEDGEKKLYQDGPVTTMLDPHELIGGWSEGGGKLAEGTIMFCGTLAAIGGIRPSTSFECELHDPVLDRRIRHTYEAECLAVYG